MGMTPEHLLELQAARELLEKPGLAARITAMIGAPLEKSLKMIPDKWSGSIDRAVRISLEKALSIAVLSLHKKTAEGVRNRSRFNKWAVIATGVSGGAMGLPGLVVELPISTAMMLRSIADIASSKGEDLEDLEARLSCLEVFALGGRSSNDDASETGYFAIRSLLASSVTEAAKHLAQRGIAQKGAPVMVRFLSTISSRFGIVVSEKMAAMAVPAIGAVGGGLVNGAFITHFQKIAEGHFTVRKLERIYGPEVVRAAYEQRQTASLPGQGSRLKTQD